MIFYQENIIHKEVAGWNTYLSYVPYPTNLFYRFLGLQKFCTNVLKLYTYLCILTSENRVWVLDTDWVSIRHGLDTDWTRTEHELGTN